MSAESSNLSNIEHRAVIKYFKERKRPKKFFEDMVSVLQESAPDTMVKNGLLISIRTRELEDDPRPGRPRRRKCSKNRKWHERQSYRRTWEVIARSATRQCICPHGFEAGPEQQRASRKLTTHLYSQDLAPMTISFFQFKKVTWS
ncbi:hypothetical protein EVAR_50675_1 [Eumeta japonica]|uniref:Mos1 transposase HTH domain-containing protein n=1 Tax=Eumeta variegata TaxID=151549 RepID=A0A4C1XMI6_EUMVA|nr:hypothetical protein EVAR_50675_1 [Eumeta japonica]